MTQKSNRPLPHIWRSYLSDFGHDLSDLQDETVTANSVYTDEVLSGIAANGFDAIWVHGLLHHVVPSEIFPESGEHAATHLRNMRALVERAAKHGIRVYLYMQPPRGLAQSDPFWKAHPAVQGAPMDWETLQGEVTTFCAMCTSTQPVKDFLFQSSATLMHELPGLGGVILITSSEYPSHCYRSYPYAIYRRQKRDPMPPMGCERCEQRAPHEVVNEIIQLVHDGVRSVSASAHIIVWNWSWSMLEADPSPRIISGLPDDVVLMADFERGDSKKILGKVRPIDEYSLSFAGPSQRFLDTYAIAKKRGLPMIAKLQLGTTHELATVPNLPLIGNLYEKARQMRKLHVEGFMGCWNFGNMISANTAAFNFFLDARRLPPREQALRQFAKGYFPDCDAELVRQAWEAFGGAMDSYPFSIPFIYTGPVNYALAYPLRPGALTGVSAGRSWVDDKRGDDLSACLNAPYTLAEVIRGFGALAREWKNGAQLFECALAKAQGENAIAEKANAWVCYHIFRSTWNVFRVYKLRLKWTDDLLPEYSRIVRDEIENLEAALPYVEADQRFGFHAEPHAYLFDAAGIRKKLRALRKQLAE
jgi:hypothetical protein